MRPLRRTGPGRLSLLTLVAVCGCGAGEDGGARPLFCDVSAELGLPVVEGPGPDGSFHLPEVMQGGIGLLDYDGDGALDILHVRAPLPGGPDARISNRLYRQGPDGTFSDVTAEAGLDAPGFGQGLAIGDADNDGDPDVYVTNYGPDRFYRNDGNGRFTDATASAGFEGDRWSTSAAFFDYDGDGHLDLYVAHYLRLDPAKRCTDPRGRREYCGPWSFHGTPDRLYHNEGDGTFTDRTRSAGIVLAQSGARATGLGVLCADFTGDDLPDVFVANDLQSNQLWVNEGDGSFSEQGVQRGVAVDAYGHAEASMGVTAGDINGDGILDLFMTHLWQENNRLYVGSRTTFFRDGSDAAQLSRYDLERTGWGCGFFDFDNDGDLDLAVANGAVRRRPPLPGAPAGMWAEYVEPNQLFENDGTGLFAEVDDEAVGSFSTELGVSRGLAFGDLDDDGDVDLVVSGIDNSLRVYRNDVPAAGRHWLSVRALTRGRDAIGARVTLSAGGRDRLRLVAPSFSYLSSNDPVAHFGLGEAEVVDEIVVLWPDGERERFAASAVDREITLRQGEGLDP